MTLAQLGFVLLAGAEYAEERARYRGLHLGSQNSELAMLFSFTLRAMTKKCLELAKEELRDEE